MSDAPCEKCGSTKRNAKGACMPCRALRSRNARKIAARKAGAHEPPARVETPARCKHSSGVTEVATLAGTRTWKDARLWPRGDELVVITPKGEHVAFPAGVWRFALDTCTTCAREFSVKPKTTVAA